MSTSAMTISIEHAYLLTMEHKKTGEHKVYPVEAPNKKAAILAVRAAIIGDVEAEVQKTFAGWSVNVKAYNNCKVGAPLKCSDAEVARLCGQQWRCVGCEQVVSVSKTQTKKRAKKSTK